MFLILSATVLGADNEWSWMNGIANPYEFAVRGNQGVFSPGNTPGMRAGGVTWTDLEGNLWLFGGSGSGMNELWQFDPVSNEWAWFKGGDSIDGKGVYGSVGLSAPDNTPGYRDGSVAWRDTTGSLWLFGGTGMDSSGASGDLNDLWKYDPSINEWTWMKGSNSVNQPGTYGNAGSFSQSNTPGGRQNPVAWTDGSGNFWLFGGRGYDSSGSYGKMNDLWKFDPVTNEWAWIKGSNLGGQEGQYGVQGEPGPNNTPGARERCATWIDSSNNLWLFGGGGIGEYNDLWKYEPDSNQWTWMAGETFTNTSGVYGNPGEFAGENRPGARMDSVYWTDSTGKFWLAGGSGFDESGNYNLLNDFWKFDPDNNLWAWVGGSKETGKHGHYGVLQVFAPENIPGCRNEAVSWVDINGDFWMFGGFGNSGSGSYSYQNDLWKYDISDNQWAWMKGSNSAGVLGIYGTKGSPAQGNAPGSRIFSSQWTDNSGNLWLFGGRGYGKSYDGKLNDLWKYDPAISQWTWMKGSDSRNQTGVYGAIEEPNTAYTPGSRFGANSWTDNNGNLWLFGGQSYVSSFTDGFMNDLWKYEPESNQWAWMKGSSTANQPGVYGTNGLAAPGNTPGGRSLAISWTDHSGNFWLFGGFVNIQYGSTGYLSDLWKFNPSTKEWICVRGNSSLNQAGIYGTEGEAASGNSPGARSSSAAWVDSSNRLWMFGGIGYDSAGTYGDLNDLWRFEPESGQWTWIRGKNIVNTNGIYGTQGIASISNLPGARSESVYWTDNNGNMWLFGGVGAGSSGSGYLHDLWKYNPGLNQWIWMKGSPDVNQNGVYGMPGSAHPDNIPGSRSGSTGWTDNDGSFWLFGSAGINDLWKFVPNVSGIEWDQLIQY